MLDTWAFYKKQLERCLHFRFVLQSDGRQTHTELKNGVCTTRPSYPVHRLLLRALSDYQWANPNCFSVLCCCLNGYSIWRKRLQSGWFIFYFIGMMVKLLKLCQFSVVSYQWSVFSFQFSVLKQERRGEWLSPLHLFSDISYQRSAISFQRSDLTNIKRREWHYYIFDYFIIWNVNSSYERNISLP